MKTTTTDFNWSTSFKELHARLQNEGYFRPDPAGTIVVSIIAVSFASLGYYALLTGPDLIGRVLASLLIAFSMVQAGFVAHDVGHGAVVDSRGFRGILGRLFLSLFTGLSYAHFQSIHRKHHPWCNSPDKDPDMQTTVFRLFPGDDNGKSSLFSWVAPRQHWLFWPLVSLQGFTLKIDSFNTLRKGHPDKVIEYVMLVLHLALWIAIPAMYLGIIVAVINYLLITWFIGPYLNSVFVVNHMGMPINDSSSKVNHFKRQLLSTRNLEKGLIADYYFGGLNNHIEHHIFPKIPMRRLKAVRKVTSQFCEEKGLPYQETTFFKAIGGVRDYLKSLAKNENVFQ